RKYRGRQLPVDAPNRLLELVEAGPEPVDLLFEGGARGLLLAQQSVKISTGSETAQNQQEHEYSPKLTGHDVVLFYTRCCIGPAAHGRPWHSVRPSRRGWCSGRCVRLIMLGCRTAIRRSPP